MSGVRSSTARARRSSTARSRVTALLGQACKVLLAVEEGRSSAVCSELIETRAFRILRCLVVVCDLTYAWRLEMRGSLLLLRHSSRLRGIRAAFKKTDPSSFWKKNGFLVSFDARFAFAHSAPRAVSSRSCAACSCQRIALLQSRRVSLARHRLLPRAQRHSFQSWTIA